ncbi:hypothetical protein IG631_11020 [Alternaria alternata]|nr:hypothetical protein IG631_11020 [Alternaria alternata]
MPGPSCRLFVMSGRRVTRFGVRRMNVSPEADEWVGGQMPCCRVRRPAQFPGSGSQGHPTPVHERSSSG